MRVLIPTSLFALLCCCSEAAFGPNGKCGSQYGGASCDPEKGGICCSISGFCGESDEYCLVASGCQLNCTDGTPTARSPSQTSAPPTASSSGGLTSA
ncbi:hypothetical protein EJ04DRAFT_515047 [Polyplosphaeria fusca]|uniref:Chitin-binding type-1 domain-containing protein n=1 Tax=Polyplosphaeria fusca TaxID=682080 RepID=A0A9P4UW76_9PLEO|nr:hypothetical protein EJ04DRAFT_515047 [Polyplosphaeria fusca]